MTIETIELNYFATFIGNNHATLREVSGRVAVDNIPANFEKVCQDVIAQHSALSMYTLRKLKIFYVEEFIC